MSVTNKTRPMQIDLHCWRLQYISPPRSTMISWKTYKGPKSSWINRNYIESIKIARMELPHIIWIICAWCAKFALQTKDVLIIRLSIHSVLDQSSLGENWQMHKKCSIFTLFLMFCQFCETLTMATIRIDCENVMQIVPNMKNHSGTFFDCCGQLFPNPQNIAIEMNFRHDFSPRFRVLRSQELKTIECVWIVRQQRVRKHSRKKVKKKTSGYARRCMLLSTNIFAYVFRSFFLVPSFLLTHNYFFRVVFSFQSIPVDRRLEEFIPIFFIWQIMMSTAETHTRTAKGSKRKGRRGTATNWTYTQWRNNRHIVALDEELIIPYP